MSHKPAKEDRGAQLHFAAGFAVGIPLRFTLGRWARRAIQRIDRFGWDREVAQHDPDLSAHQISEAEAWGLGARKSSGVRVEFPSPPYPA